MKQRWTIRIGVGLLLAVLLFFAVVPLERAKEDASDWMADLSDERRISALAIPGTHDSGALYSIADVAGKCQSLSIAEQLRAGVRFFDIRLQLRGEKLAVVHSFVDQMTDFADVLDDLTAFLRAHPKEFLFVSIKQDASAQNTKTSFADAVEQMLADGADVVSTERSLPQTVGEARGKMHIFARYADAEIGIPAYDGWQDNTSFVLEDLYVQDRYAIDDPNDKISEIQTALEEQNTGDHALVLNFMSCYLTHGFPPMYAAPPAKPILSWLEQALQENLAPGGVLICDFMTSALAAMIWRCNFR